MIQKQTFPKPSSLNPQPSKRYLCHRWLKYTPERINLLEQVVHDLSEAVRQQVYHALATYDCWGKDPDNDYCPTALVIAHDLISYFHYCRQDVTPKPIDTLLSSPVYLKVLELEAPELYYLLTRDPIGNLSNELKHLKEKLKKEGINWTLPKLKPLAVTKEYLRCFEKVHREKHPRKFDPKPIPGEYAFLELH